MKTYHIPIFVPHKGCPHDCVFCNQRHITGKVSETSPEDVVNITESYLKTIPEGDERYIEIAFFGGSFTGIEIEKQTELLKAAYKYVSDGKIQGIRCSTRPDYINPQILDNLKKYSVTCIELGVQSTDSTVLEKSRRGHTFDDVKKAASLIKQYKISLGLQMMTGLPGDTFEKTLKTAEDIISLKPDCVRIYPTLVVEDTELLRMYEGGIYTPLSVNEAAEQLAQLIPMFRRNNIEIIRIGLQTTDEINEKTVKGPYHPALKELAESIIVRNALEKSAAHCFKGKVTEIECSPDKVSVVIGHKRCNAQYFEKKYHTKIKAVQNNALKENMLKICDKNIDIYALV